jgi:cysteine desulfuration protein SufE
MTIRDKEAEIEEEFGLYDDWTDKYEYIIELGRTLPAFDAAFRNEDQLIKGCQSQVWLHAAFDGSVMHFNADSDAQIPKGIVALLLRVLNDGSPKEVVEADLSFLDRIGLKEHLSPTRANGLVSMIKQMKFYALSYLNNDGKKH